MNHDNGTSMPRRRRMIRTAEDVRRLLEAEIVRLTAQPDLDPLRRARAISECGRVALLAIKLSTLDDRVAALEDTLEARRDRNRESGLHE